MSEVKKTMTDKGPVLGIVRLDYEEATEESSAELIARHAVTPFVVDDPSFWRVPYRSAIAKGADAEGIKIPTAEATRGMLEAAGRLDGHTQLIIGDCGYMWASRKQLYRRTCTPTVTSGLEFLDFALRISNLPVGIITWDAKSLAPLLEDHAEFDRLRFVSVSELPDWAKSVQSPSEYSSPGGWTKDRMSEQFGARLAEAFAENGTFRGVGILVLECTLVPDFRKTIRTVTSVPVFDLVHFAKAALE